MAAEPSRAVPAPRRVPGPLISFHFAWLKAGRPPRPGGRAEAAAGCAAAPARQAPEVTAPGARPLPGAGPASLPHRSAHSPPPAPLRVPCKVERGQEKEVWPRFLFLSFGGWGAGSLPGQWHVVHLPQGRALRWPAVCRTREMLNLRLRLEAEYLYL